VGARRLSFTSAPRALVHHPRPCAVCVPAARPAPALSREPTQLIPEVSCAHVAAPSRARLLSDSLLLCAWGLFGACNQCRRRLCRPRSAAALFSVARAPLCSVVSPCTSHTHSACGHHHAHHQRHPRIAAQFGQSLAHYFNAPRSHHLHLSANSLTSADTACLTAAKSHQAAFAFPRTPSRRISSLDLESRALHSPR
jgi:hypothetical protein